MPKVSRLHRIRGRVPLGVFILLLVVAVLLFGFACALMTDHPGQVVDRAAATIAALPPIIEVWSLLAVELALASSLLWLRHAHLAARSSPPILQRFLF